MKFVLSSLLFVALSVDGAHHGLKNTRSGDIVAIKERRFNHHQGRSAGHVDSRTAEIIAVKESRAKGLPNPRDIASECREIYSADGAEYVDGDGANCDFFETNVAMCEDGYNTPDSMGCTPLMICGACCHFIYPGGSGFVDEDGADCGFFNDHPEFCEGGEDFDNQGPRGCDAEDVCSACA